MDICLAQKPQMRSSSPALCSCLDEDTVYGEQGLWLTRTHSPRCCHRSLWHLMPGSAQLSLHGAPPCSWSDSESAGVWRESPPGTLHVFLCILILVRPSIILLASLDERNSVQLYWAQYSPATPNDSQEASCCKCGLAGTSYVLGRRRRLQRKNPPIWNHLYESSWFLNP